MATASVPTETHMKLTDTKQHLSQVVNRVAQGEAHVIIENSGLAVAAIISAEEYRRFMRLEAEQNARFEAMGRISDAFADVPLDELDAEVERAVANVRSKRQAAVNAAR